MMKVKYRIWVVLAAYFVALAGVVILTGEKAPESKAMTLTVPKIGVDEVPVHTGAVNDEAGLKGGVLHVQGTGYPWESGANVYIAGHDLGFPGTPSDHVFWNLSKLEPGDEFTIEDAEGTVYTYRVYKTFTIEPTETWVMQPVAGKDVCTLQVCVPHNVWSHRLIVRGELV